MIESQITTSRISGKWIGSHESVSGDLLRQVKEVHYELHIYTVHLVVVHAWFQYCIPPINQVQGSYCNLQTKLLPHGYRAQAWSTWAINLSRKKPGFVTYSTETVQYLSYL